MKVASPILPRTHRSWCARLLLLVALLGFCVCSPSAPNASAYPAQFGEEGGGAGQFVGLGGLAVSRQSGQVIVLDRNGQRVDRFGAEGEFLEAWGAGVADGETLAAQTCTSRCFTGLAAGVGPGEFDFPVGVAVDNDVLSPSFSDVYVGDARNYRVQEFSAQGAFIRMIGGEVNETKDKTAGASEAEKNLCTAVSGDVCTAGTAGGGQGQFAVEPEAIAVGADGTVYVGDENRVQEFSAEGVYQGEIPLSGVGRVEALALDGAGDIYLTSSEVPGVREYDQGGVQIGPARDATGSPTAIAAGPSEELFVADGQGTNHILEYDSAGVQQASFGRSSEGTPSGIAYSESLGALYVSHEDSVQIIAPPAPGPLVLQESCEGLATTAATLSATVNDEGPGASYSFEYGATTGYGQSTASTALGGEPFEDQVISTSLAGLQPRTLYHFRVVVADGSTTTYGPDGSCTTLPPVSIDTESVTSVSTVGARLEAELNPHGLASEYHFEFGLSTSYEDSAPLPRAGVEPAEVDVPVALDVQGLTPDTTYHYCIVASNQLGAVEGEDHTFTTQGGQLQPTLLDGRQWEMVSPPDKQGASLLPITEEGGVIQAAADGNAISYVATAPIEANPAGNRSVAYSQVLSQRTGGGWHSQEISAPHETVAGLHGGNLSEYVIFSTDLSSGLIEPAGTAPLSPEATEHTPYLRESDGDYLPLVTAANVAPGTRFGGGAEPPEAEHGGVEFSLGTPDLSHLLLTSPEPLTAGLAPSEGANVFEWSAGTLQLVSILPDGKPAGAEGGVAAVGYLGRIKRGALSEDGSRVIFSTIAGGNHLYLRDLMRGETVRLDAPEAGTAEAEPVFAFANSEGSRVLFVDSARLTADATAKPGKPDLYMCDVGVVGAHLHCALKDLTVDRNPREAANVQGTVIGADSGGEHVYFVAAGALAPGASKEGCCNLYVADASTGAVKFIAQLAPNDEPDWTAGQGNLATLTARVSENGRYLAFMSQRSLTGYDNRDAVSGMPDAEVFLFDLDSEKLTCVSCDPSGARPHGLLDTLEAPGPLVDRPKSWQGRWLAASLPGWTSFEAAQAIYQSRYLSDSGRLFFNSATPLVAQDGNGKEDVYEYEPNGIGSCTQESGCVGLVSSGQSSVESAFLDASADGDDVFFLTASKLSSSDLDSTYDVYNAHVCSAAVPCANEAQNSLPPCATADACRAAPSPQPGVFAAPASQSFSGPGNAAAAAERKTRARPLTRAQKLKRALAACRKKAKSRRAACVRQARRRYGTTTTRGARTPARKRGK
jgi:hypothetical protein